MKLPAPRFSKSQWKIFASAVSNISQAIILFALAAFFVPETVGLGNDFSRIAAFFYFISGLLILLGAGILASKGE